MVLRLIPKPTSDRVSATPAPTRKPDDLIPLVERCRRGERDATKTLLAAVGPSMLKMIRRVMGPKHPDLDDILQEAFIGILHALPGFRGDSTTRHFACRIAILTALKARRASGTGWTPRPGAGTEPNRPIAATSGVSLDEDRWADVDPHDWALASCRRQLLRRLLDALPPAQAEVMVLQCIGGLTVEEIALATPCPVETVRSRLRLAKTALRERVAADPALSELLEESL